MSSPGASSPEPEQKVDALEPDATVLEQMNSEYGILQDKLDKIGGFRTTIRGWSVTLVIASIIAAGSSKGVSPYFLGLLFIFIYAFYRMEQKQNQYGVVFGARVIHLEKQIRAELRVRIEGGPILGFYPGIAHHLHSSMKKKSPGKIAMWVTDPDRFFYIAQGMAVAIAMAALIWLSPTSKSPDTQEIIQIETAPSGAQVKEFGAASDRHEASKALKREEQKNVKEKGH